MKAGNYHLHRPGSSVKKEISTEMELFRKIGLRFLIVLAVLAAMYFWGLAIISNIDTFWKTISFSGNASTPARSKIITPASPRLQSLPTATKAESINISGYADPGVTVTLFVNDIQLEDRVVDKEGTFSFESISLTDGENKFFVKASIEGRAESRPSRTVTVIYKKKAPVLSLLEPTDRSTFSQKESEIRVSGKTDPNTTVRVNELQAVVDELGNFKILYSLKDGENKLTIEAEDIAGNKTDVYRTVYFSRTF